MVEQEVATLMDAFERGQPWGDRDDDASERLFRIGKSSLVNEVHKSQRRVYFISGKFDQFKRNIPYVSDSSIPGIDSCLRKVLTK